MEEVNVAGERYLRDDSRISEDLKLWINLSNASSGNVIPFNIAEGAGRKSPKEFSRFICIAQGSASELDTQVELSTIVGYLDDKKAQMLIDRLMNVTKMFYGLSRSIAR